jgi:O-acetyl-ADP-ribose deacetylase (regulator of RNase III)
MIRYIQGNLLQADTEALVNAVNTVGVMGKGIALAVKQTIPRTSRNMRRPTRRSRSEPAACL